MAELVRLSDDVVDAEVEQFNFKRGFSCFGGTETLESIVLNKSDKKERKIIRSRSRKNAKRKIATERRLPPDLISKVYCWH